MFSEFSTHEVTFQMNQKFHVPWDKDSHIEHFCSRPISNVIQCTTHEPIKGWNLKTRMIFGANKMVDEKTNLDKNISTNKTYVKLKDDQQENTSEDINGLEIDESATEPDYVLLNKIDQGDWE